MGYLVWINGVAAGLLEVDRPEKWPGLEVLTQHKIAGFGWRYRISAPEATLRSMLDECDSRGAQRGTREGWDQDKSGAPGCRKAAVAIRRVLKMTERGERTI